ERVALAGHARSAGRRGGLPEQLDALDLLILERTIARIALHVGDLLHHVQTDDDAAEHGVLAVEVRRRSLGDEELRTVGARAGVGHREHARTVVAQLAHDLVSEAITRATRAPARARGLVVGTAERIADL